MRILVTAKSKDDLKRAQEHMKIFIRDLKAENIVYAAEGRVNLAMLQMILARNQDDFKKVYERVEGINLEDCIKIFEETGNKYGLIVAKNRMAICYLALKRDKDALDSIERSIEIVKNGPDEYWKAEYELTLAYIKMTSGLSEFKERKEELSDEVRELIQSAYEKLYRIEASNRFVVLAVEAIAKYLQNKINYDELLKELDGVAKELENTEFRIRSWIIKQTIDAIKKKGDIDEDLLRLEGVKLLLA